MLCYVSIFNNNIVINFSLIELLSPKKKNFKRRKSLRKLVFSHIEAKKLLQNLFWQLFFAYSLVKKPENICFVRVWCTYMYWYAQSFELKVLLYLLTNALPLSSCLIVYSTASSASNRVPCSRKVSVDPTIKFAPQVSRLFDHLTFFLFSLISKQSATLCLYFSCNCVWKKDGFFSVVSHSTDSTELLLWVVVCCLLS